MEKIVNDNITLKFNYDKFDLRDRSELEKYFAGVLELTQAEVNFKTSDERNGMTCGSGQISTIEFLDDCVRTSITWKKFVLV